jgi:hypothetical protein
MVLVHIKIEIKAQMKHLDKELLSCLTEFKEKILSIEDGTRQVPVSGSSHEPADTTKTKVQTAFNALTKGKDVKTLSDFIQGHFNELSPFLVLCTA